MRTSETVMRTAGAAMTAVFIVWAYYQRNDIDPVRWIAVYTAASISSLLFVIGKLPSMLPILLGAITTIWGVYLLFVAKYDQPLIEIEEWREGTGLIIVSLWMGAMPLYQRKLNKNAQS